jgi:3D-(3,5/4)-trihydroxycyclohexane-1,2-dione acylhydrolase (decyclizing)
MSDTVRLTAAQALVRYLAALSADTGTGARPLFAGVFAIFGHGNVAGIGEALYRHRNQLPTYRAHNEQAMAHAAIAFAKASMRRRMMACTTSIGPGATNMVTAAALAHVNRLPVLLLPGDVFASRAPDPVLQQVEDFHDGTVSANDCFRPVSRYFDRIMHPEQLLAALPRAIHVLTDAALCGPVTLALPQDVQTMAFDYPEQFFAPEPVVFRAQAPSEAELVRAAELLRSARRPLVVAGGGVLYGLASKALAAFADRHGVPVAETQGGKGALAWDHPLQLGAIGVTGSSAANDFDALKWRAVELVGDAALGLDALSHALVPWQSDASWQSKAKAAASAWQGEVERITGRRDATLPYEGEVIGAVQRSATDSASADTVVCAAGTLPAELHKLWRVSAPGGYHVEYGYSCMGYEIAGGLGVKMARPEREVIVIVGDGSYLMLNSEIATSVLLGKKLVVVVLDNHGYGCINRLQRACGGAPFNNLFDDCVQAADGAPRIDFAAHAASLGALAENVKTIPELEAALKRARAAARTCVVCIETDPDRTTEAGGWWWDVAVPEVSDRAEVRRAREAYEKDRKQQKP